MAVFHHFHRSHCHPFYRWADNPERSCFNREITARAGHALLAIEVTATAALDVIIGTGVATLNLFTAGKNMTLSEKTVNFLEDGSRRVLATMYTHLIRVINPRADFPKEGEDGDGLITGIVCGKVMELANYFKSCHWIVAHTMTRVVHIVNIPISIICRIIDFMIGLIAVAFSILTLGKSMKLNDIAYRGLFIVAIIPDVFSGLTKAVNPWSFSGFVGEMKNYRMGK